MLLAIGADSEAIACLDDLLAEDDKETLEVINLYISTVMVDGKVYGSPYGDGLKCVPLFCERKALYIYLQSALPIQVPCDGLNHLVNHNIWTDARSCQHPWGPAHPPQRI